MTKARLIYLLLVASMFAALALALCSSFHGFNNGGSPQ